MPGSWSAREIADVYRAFSSATTSASELQTAIIRVRDIIKSVDRPTRRALLKSGLGKAIRQVCRRGDVTHAAKEVCEELISWTMQQERAHQCSVETSQAAASHGVISVGATIELAEVGDTDSENDIAGLQGKCVLAECSSDDASPLPDASVCGEQAQPSIDSSMCSLLSRDGIVDDGVGKAIANLYNQLSAARDGVVGSGCSRKRRISALRECSTRELLAELNSRLPSRKKHAGKSSLKAFVANGSGVSATTVERILQRLSSRQTHVDDQQSGAAVSSGPDPFIIAIHVVLRIVVSGHPFSDYVRIMNLLKTCGCVVPGKHLNWSFPRAVEYIALTEVTRPMLRNICFTRFLRWAYSQTWGFSLMVGL